MAPARKVSVFLLSFGAFAASASITDDVEVTTNAAASTPHQALVHDFFSLLSPSSDYLSTVTFNTSLFFNNIRKSRPGCLR